jgi:PXA domain
MWHANNDCTEQLRALPASSRRAISLVVTDDAVVGIIIFGSTRREARIGVSSQRSGGLRYMAARRTSRFSTSHRSAEARSAASTPTSKIPVSLARRLLFPQLSPGSDIPFLLAADDPELNAELYDFLALTLRGYVTPWWSKITRHDKEFLPEITRIVAIFLRSVEARLAVADLPSFIFRDIPTIVSQHYADYRSACAKVGTSYATGGSSTLPQIFHQLQPHMAISSDGYWNETYIRQSVEHVLKSCLPPADWEAETERTIVREILAKVVLGNVFSRLTQPWFIQKLILDLLGPPPDNQSKVKPRTAMLNLRLIFAKLPDPPSRPASRGRFTFQSIVVFFLSAVQTISGLCLTAIALSQKALYTIRAINSSSPSTTIPHYDHLARPGIDMMAEILTMRSRTSSSSLLSLFELCTGFSRPFIAK